MKSFHELWSECVKGAGFKTLNAFLTKHDPQGAAYQTTTKNLTGMPGEDRVRNWAAILKLSPEKTDELVAAANRERVMVASDGARLGPGIQALKAEVDTLRSQLAELRKDRDGLRGVLLEIKGEFTRLGLKLPDSLSKL